MKECPICGSICFDDMPICFGCMHKFTPEDTRRHTKPLGQQENQAQKEKEPKVIGNGPVVWSRENESVQNDVSKDSLNSSPTTERTTMNCNSRTAPQSESFVVHTSATNRCTSKGASIEVPLIATPLLSREDTLEDTLHSELSSQQNIGSSQSSRNKYGEYELVIRVCLEPQE